MNRSGLLIVFEGVEGGGKTTQVEMLAETLRAARPGHEVVTTAEPGGTELGVALREMLLRHDAGEPIDPKAETLLYLADRAQHIARVIRPALERGATVICDRFNDSTVVYQGYARRLGMIRLEELTKWFLDGLEPDLVLVLDVDVDEGLARVAHRGEADRFEREPTDFHHRVRQGFLIRVEEMQQKRASDRDWNTGTPWYFAVDASGTPDVVAGHVQQYVRLMLAERAGAGAS